MSDNNGTLSKIDISSPASLFIALLIMSGIVFVGVFAIKSDQYKDLKRLNPDQFWLMHEAVVRLEQSQAKDGLRFSEWCDEEMSRSSKQNPTCESLREVHNGILYGELNGLLGLLSGEHRQSPVADIIRSRDEKRAELKLAPEDIPAMTERELCLAVQYWTAKGTCTWKNPNAN